MLLSATEGKGQPNGSQQAELCTSEGWASCCAHTIWGGHFTRINRYGILCKMHIMFHFSLCGLCFVFGKIFKISFVFHHVLGLLFLLLLFEGMRCAFTNISSTGNDGEHFSLDKCVKRLECRNRIRLQRPFQCECTERCTISVWHFQLLYAAFHVLR